jgi:hypothetical protein
MANTDGDWSPCNRYSVALREEVSQLAIEIDTIDSDVLLLIAGDFNVPRDSSILDEFLATAHTRDILAGDMRPTTGQRRRYVQHPLSITSYCVNPLHTTSLRMQISH